ncbi:MAG: EFR1 family ferrodoxin [Clostridiales bacterium]|jgi:ferredoxin|nr:EFR1 family ferrodoxin [Clostridiales bacterium]
MVLYFTAMGNSLYVAKRLDEKPISIPQIINGGSPEFKASAIGVVFPIYCAEPPKSVKEFLKKAAFQTDYLYFVMTYGKHDCDCPEWTARFCEKSERKPDYIATVKMVDNYLPAFDMNEQTAIDKNVDGQLSAIIKAVSERQKGVPIATKNGVKLHKLVALMNRIMPGFNNGKRLKMLNDKCTGCGICTKVCPVGNIKIENDGKAKRKERVCEFCLACIQLCPRKAIGIKPDKNKNARYKNPNITLEEIIEANWEKPKA